MRRLSFVLALGLSLVLAGGRSASALVIGVGAGPYGLSAATITSWLTSQGHTASVIDPSVAASFSGLDAYLSIRDGLASSPYFPVSPAIVANVSAFVAGGGGLVTEWSGTDIVMQMFGGTSLGSTALGTGTTVTIGAAHPVTAGVANFASAGQTEFNWNTDLTGTGLSVLGTIGGQTAIMVGSFGVGRVVGLSFDWQDPTWNAITGSGSSDLNQLVLNSLDWSTTAAVPEPSTLILLTGGLLGLARRARR